MRTRLILFLAAMLCVAAVPGVASAATPAGTVDLSKIEAKREVKDAIVLAGQAQIASRKKVVAKTAFADGAGHEFTLDTTVAGYDLAPAAALLNSTYHKSEISKVAIHAIPLSSMNSICGDPQAIACYRPMSGGRGELWFGTDDTDWQHSLVHEYGHHIDNQIANFSQLTAFGFGRGCPISSDGTRDWYFTRMTGSNTTDADKIYCGGTDWEHLLPELFAEDFVVLNGIHGWQLSSAKEPTVDQLKAMKYDIDNKLYTTTKKYTRTIKRKKVYWKRFTTSFFNLVRVDVKGAKKSDFDVYIYPATSNKLWEKSTKRGRNERMTTFIAPGVWDIGVYAKKKTARAKVEIKLR